MVNKKRFISKGFTLIEAVISIGVISVIIPVIFNLLFISLRAELKMKALKTVKNNGDFALEYIVSNIRENAFKPVNCAAPTTEIVADVPDTTSACFSTNNGQCFQVLVESNKLKVKNVAGCDAFLPTVSEVALTSSADVIVSKTDGTGPNTIHMSIDVPDAGIPNARFSTSSVTISYRIASTKDPTTYLNYYSKAKIRNY